MNPSTSVTRAKKAGIRSTDQRGEDRHSHTPHIYVVYWPHLGVLKIGISAKARWLAWECRGGKVIATMTTCCMEHAARIEAWLLSHLADTGTRAFKIGRAHV